MLAIPIILALPAVLSPRHADRLRRQWRRNPPLRDCQIPVDRWHNIIGEPTLADTEMPNDNRPAGARHPADIDRNRWPALILPRVAGDCA
jgi:hypothetical protein